MSRDSNSLRVANEGLCRLRHDEGLTLLFVAMLMTLILILAALVIDGGIGYQSHRQSQNAADTGAMAGVRVVEQLNFFPSCSATITTACTTFTSNADIAASIKRQAQNTGADIASGGVLCWLLDGATPPARLAGAPEFCSSGTPPSNTQRLAASGVEVQARQTKSTYFAGLADRPTTTASTTAKAYIYNFTGGTAAPFMMCGDRASWDASTGVSQTNWSYDIVQETTVNGVTTYSIKPSAVRDSLGRPLYYAIQAAKIPTCGGGSSAFKGQGGAAVIDVVPGDYPVDTGTGADADITIAVAGIMPCGDLATNPSYKGCGMLIPIVRTSYATGSNTYARIVAWTAWQVWGSGTGSYSFSGSPSDPVGTSCRNPISPGGGGVKYCGKLLGSASVTAGSGTGAGTAGQPHLLRLIA